MKQKVVNIVHYHYRLSLRNNATTLEKIGNAVNKIEGFFNVGVIDKFKKKQIKSSCDFLKKELKINEKILISKIFHRCNKCYMSWNIHLELKRRFQSLFFFRNDVSPLIDMNLPKTDKFYKGLIFLNEKSENVKVTNHVFNVKKILSKTDSNLLLLAKNQISVGEINKALATLASFTNKSENVFFQNNILQLQARYSTFVQEKIRGILSHQDELIQRNKISNDLISVINEINRYRIM